MKIYLFIILLFFLGCAKNKTVMICGDHVCINKDEANQYFEENLSIEVKILNYKKKEIVDLVELNLKNDSTNKKKITINKKKDTKEEIKILSKQDVEKIKHKIKKTNEINKIAKKQIIKDKINNSKLKKSDEKEIKLKKIAKKEIIKVKLNNSKFKNDDNKFNKTYKINKEVVDVCTILDKCNIEEISKYLLKQGKDKNFPKLTIKQ